YASGNSPKTPNTRKNGETYRYGEALLSRRRRASERPRRGAAALPPVPLSGVGVRMIVMASCDAPRPGRTRIGDPASMKCAVLPCRAGDVLQELLPRRGGRLLVLLDALDGVRGSGLEVTLMRAEDLRLQRQRRGGEDLADRCVAEERVSEGLDG